MMRLAEDLIYFAIETKIEDRGKFIKSLLKRTLTLIIFKEMAPQLFLRLAQRTEYKYLLSNR